MDIKYKAGMIGVKMGTDENEMINKLNRRGEPVIQTITSWNADTPDFCSKNQNNNGCFDKDCGNDTSGFYASGMLIRVKNGKGILRETFFADKDATYATLMFGAEPLFQLQGEEYFCPTCQKIVRSGYGSKCMEGFHADKLNKPGNEVSLEEVLEEIKPLLGLLPDYYYIVLDTELYPTDGNGHLFCELPNDDMRLAGSCLYYSNTGQWGKLRPHFTIATQSVQHLNWERVEYYRQHSGCRAVAYYMDGYLTALIDGHHKAMAAAIDHKKLPALVIAACTTGYTRIEDESATTLITTLPFLHGYTTTQNGFLKRYIGVSDIKFDCQKYNIEDITEYFEKGISDSEMRNINAKIPQNVLPAELPYDLQALANAYPDAEGVFYIDQVGKISDEWLDEILSGKYVCNYEEICNLIMAMGKLRHKRLFEISDYFFRRNEYTAYPKYHNVEMITNIVEALANIPKTEELENYLIDMMIELEAEHPYIAGKILEYL